MTEPTAIAAAPLTADEFAALMARLGPFERHPALALAVSGGADSMALALLAAGWATARGGSVVALVVDHRLRPSSGEEAARVQGWLAARNIAAHILCWSGPRPQAAIQERAREARHGLLAEACRARGILHLLLAHHRDDQAETVAMRAARGSGMAGMAGMAAIREITGLRLLRPLLPVAKRRLVATLEAVGQAWIEDPSNRDRRFERARLRAGDELDTGRWTALAREMAARRRDREQADAAFLAAHARLHPLGFAVCGRQALAGLDPARRASVVARLLTCLGGRGLPPRSPQIARLGDWLSRPAQDGARTAAGCRVAAAGRRVTVCREAGRIGERRRLAPGEVALWDGRFRVAAEEPLELAAAGPAGRALLGKAARRRLGEQGVPAAAVEALPAIWRDGRPQPPLADDADRPPPGLRWSFGPRIPLAAAAFGAANVV